jgi:uncharacterized membrane protein YfcA
MLTPIDILLFLVTGFVAGTFGGLLGLGGATILVPALTLGFGLPVYLAVMVSLVSNFFVSTTAVISYNRQGLIHWRTVYVMTLASIAGVIIGTIIATRSPAGLIKVLFGVFLLVLVIEGVLRVRWKGPGKLEKVPFQASEKVNVPGYSILGFIMGLLGAMLGIGGGTLATPVQHTFFKLPLKNAIANSLATIIVSAFLGAMLYFIMGAGHLFSTEEALVTAATVVPGSVAGAKFATIAGKHIPERYIKFIFYTVILYIAYNMIKSGMGW